MGNSKSRILKSSEVVSVEDMLCWLKSSINKFPDKRTGDNLKYSMEDVALGAFSIFFTQSPSFLAHQISMEKAHGKNNARSLFGIEEIPTDNHIRDLLDPVEPALLGPVYKSALLALEQGGYIESYRYINGNILVALDGVHYHNSTKIHCENCSIKNHKNGTTSYSHSLVAPVIVAPGKSAVFPLEPEFVIPQDGNKKQDCENRAAKRWIKKFGEKGRFLGTTFLGDDLYSHQPLCLLILKEKLNYIFVCKPKSHKVLYEWINELESLKEVKKVVENRCRGRKKETDTYRFVNNVPLRDGEDALMVNWCEIHTTKPDGTQVYHNSFVTNHKITKENVTKICTAGRTRWKIENENNNVLKTKGYHLTHNYGHGKNHLSTLFCSMIILSFLFHSIFEVNDHRYRRLRQALPSRETFFEDIRALSRYMCFEGWDELLVFMLSGLKLDTS